MTDAAADYWRDFAGWAVSDFNLPHAANHRIAAAFIDTSACCLAGFSAEVFSAARRLGEDPSGRAFALAVAGHAFDFDDYDVPSIGHPSVVMVPVCLALAGASHGISDLFRAYAVGVEAMARLGEMVNPAHYEAGWHATATLGGAGAAAAAGVMLGLNRDQMFSALSLAVGMTGGMKAQFGSAGKPANAGFAARRGIDSAVLAQAGLDGAAASFGHLGFAGVFQAARAVPQTQPGAPLSILQHGLIAKPSPCCGYLSRIVQMLEDIRRTEAPNPGAIAKIILHVPPRNAAVIAQPIPQTPDQARFSAVYCAAVTMIHGLPVLSDFLPPALERPEVIALAGRVQLRPLPANLSPADLSPDDPDHVEVHMTDGQILKRSEGVVPGSPACPLSRADLRRKLDSCRALLTAETDALADRIMAIETEADPAGFAAALWAHQS